MRRRRRRDIFDRGAAGAAAPWNAPPFVFGDIIRGAMATDTMETNVGAPLTVLSEEEQMFQQSVREFAVERIRPLVHDMDRDAKMSPDLIREFFDLGVMGI